MVRVVPRCGTPFRVLATEESELSLSPVDPRLSTQERVIDMVWQGSEDPCCFRKRRQCPVHNAMKSGVLRCDGGHLLPAQAVQAQRAGPRRRACGALRAAALTGSIPPGSVNGALAVKLEAIFHSSKTIPDYPGTWTVPRLAAGKEARPVLVSHAEGP